jgi:uncharacterized membrane protein
LRRTVITATLEEQMTLKLDKQTLHEAEERLLNELKARWGRIRQIETRTRPKPALTLGQRIADLVASTMGSWRFIIIQSSILLLWIGLNVTAYIQHWDPYPFILLNLALSFQAAYAAPFIMMSQNRRQDIDRLEAENDHRINMKAELEIKLLHQKIDQLREQELLTMAKVISELTEMLKAEREKP